MNVHPKSRRYEYSAVQIFKGIPFKATAKGPHPVESML